MSKETLEELKAIIAGKPSGATHCDNAETYYKMDGHGRQWGLWKGVWCVCVGCNTMRMPASMRSLSDIERIIELMEAAGDMLQIFAGSPGGYWRNELNAARKAL